jgi:hypothetical protein
VGPGCGVGHFFEPCFVRVLCYRYIICIFICICDPGQTRIGRDIPPKRRLCSAPQPDTHAPLHAYASRGPFPSCVCACVRVCVCVRACVLVAGGGVSVCDGSGHAHGHHGRHGGGRR